MARDQLKKFANALDEEAGKLPEAKEMLFLPKSDAVTNTLAKSGFWKIFQELLRYLCVGKIEVDRWHKYSLRVVFPLMQSPYFKMGDFGKCSKVPVNEKLEGVISFGWDEEGDYTDKDYRVKPELVLWYQNGSFTTDINLFKASEWRKVIDEFFDVSKASRKSLDDFV